MGTNLALGKTNCTDQGFQFTELQGVEIQAACNLFHHTGVLWAIGDGIGRDILRILSLGRLVGLDLGDKRFLGLQICVEVVLRLTVLIPFCEEFVAGCAEPLPELLGTILSSQKRTLLSSKMSLLAINFILATSRRMS